MKGIVCMNGTWIENINESEHHDQRNLLGENQNANLYQHFRNLARTFTAA